jgi:hypothetical protein
MPCSNALLDLGNGLSWVETLQSIAHLRMTASEGGKEACTVQTRWCTTSGYKGKVVEGKRYLGADSGAIHNCVAPVQFVCIVYLIEAFLCSLVSRVNDPPEVQYRHLFKVLKLVLFSSEVAQHMFLWNSCKCGSYFL